MKRNGLSLALAAMLVTGCVAAPVRTDDAPVRAAVANAAAGSPALPAPGDAYLDAGWFAQELTVQRAVQGALLNNPRVRAELARLDGAQAERVQAGLLRNPMASLMVLRPEGGGRYELDYSLMQSLFDLLSRSRRIEQAHAAQRRVEAEVIMALVAIAQDTEAAYYQALAAAARLSVQDQRLELEAQALRLLERQAKQGVATGAAVLEQQAANAMQAHEVQSAEAELADARGALAGQLGLPSAKSLVLPREIPSVELPGLDEIQLQAAALANRAERRAADAGVEEARAAAALQSGASRNTDPSIGVAGMRESGGMSLGGLALQISLPIFDNGQARRQAAMGKLAEAEASAEATRRRIPLEVERALAALLTAQAAVGHAEHHQRQQQQLEQLALGNYRQGASDYFQYRLSSRARLDAGMDQIQARQAAWAAWVDLQRATGVASVGAD